MFSYSVIKKKKKEYYFVHEVTSLIRKLIIQRIFLAKTTTKTRERERERERERLI